MPVVNKLPPVILLPAIIVVAEVIVFPVIPKMALILVPINDAPATVPAVDINPYDVKLANVPTLVILG